MCYLFIGQTLQVYKTTMQLYNDLKPHRTAENNGILKVLQTDKQTDRSMDKQSHEYYYGQEKRDTFYQEYLGF